MVTTERLALRRFAPEVIHLRVRVRRLLTEAEEFVKMSDAARTAAVGWRKSARCVSDNHCVEVADLGGTVGLRNSRLPEVSLSLSEQAWRDLIAGVKAGEFDRPQH